MKNLVRRFFLVCLCLIFFGAGAKGAGAKDARVGANLRRGNLYFKKVCQACHAQEKVTVDPHARTIEDWVLYLAKDQHGVSQDGVASKTTGSVRFYMGKTYREQVKASNAVAKKFLSLSEEQIFQDIRAFFMRHASDFDGPNPCQ